MTRCHTGGHPSSLQLALATWLHLEVSNSSPAPPCCSHGFQKDALIIQVTTPWHQSHRDCGLCTIPGSQTPEEGERGNLASGVSILPYLSRIVFFLLAPGPAYICISLQVCSQPYIRLTAKSGSRCDTIQRGDLSLVHPVKEAYAFRERQVRFAQHHLAGQRTGWRRGCSVRNGRSHATLLPHRRLVLAAMVFSAWTCAACTRWCSALWLSSRSGSRVRLPGSRT